MLSICCSIYIYIHHKKIFVNTLVLGKPPGRTQYDGNKYNYIWQQVVAVYRDAGSCGSVDDFHDEVTELCPWFAPPSPGKKWMVSHIECLIADSDTNY
jgi:hypothetical protein